MKIVNPTDEEFNAAFAERVAGWKWQKGAPVTYWGSYIPRGWRKPDGRLIEGELPFTRSFDAVLPWLEKFDAIITRSAKEGDWRVVLLGGRCDSDPSLPRAAVIALLRAHGVEVEFTQ